MPHINELREFAALFKANDVIAALDISKKHIGIATSATAHRIVTPRHTIVRKKADDDSDRLRNFIDHEGIRVLIIGLPLLKSGSLGSQGQAVRDMAHHICRDLPVPYFFQDEAFSTAEAEDRVRQYSARKSQEGAIDHFAAAIILEDFLNALKRLEQQTSQQ